MEHLNRDSAQVRDSGCENPAADVGSHVILDGRVVKGTATPQYAGRPALHVVDTASTTARLLHPAVAAAPEQRGFLMD